MNKYCLILALSFIGLTLFCSQYPDDEIISTPETEPAVLETVNRYEKRFFVDWTAVNEELNRQDYVWDSYVSYIKEHGLGIDQQFVDFGRKYAKYPTSGLMALLNKKDSENVNCSL